VRELSGFSPKSISTRGHRTRRCPTDGKLTTLLYAGLWQVWHWALVRPAWSAGSPVPPLVPTPAPPTWWQLVQLSIPARGWGMAGGAAAAGAAVGAAAGFVGAAAGAVVGATVGATVAAGFVGATVGATVGAAVGAMVAAGFVGATVAATVAAGVATAGAAVGAAAGALVGTVVGVGAAAGAHAATMATAAIREMPRTCKCLRDFTTALPWVTSSCWFHAELATCRGIRTSVRGGPRRGG